MREGAGEQMAADQDNEKDARITSQRKATTHQKPPRHHRGARGKDLRAGERTQRYRTQEGSRCCGNGNSQKINAN